MQDNRETDAASLVTLVAELQAWASNRIDAIGTQIWVADDLGFHLRGAAGQPSKPDDRSSAHRCCLEGRMQFQPDTLTVPVPLSDRRSAVCLFSFDTTLDPAASELAVARVTLASEALDRALQAERVARLSGAARMGDRLRSCLAKAHAVEHTSDVNAALTELHVLIGDLVPAENFFVVTLDESRQWLQFDYFADEFDEDISPIAFHEGRLQGSLSAIVVAAGQVIRGSSEELLAQAGIVGGLSSDQFGPMACDWLGVPMIVAGEVIGAIVLQSYRQEVRFQDTTPGILSMIAEALAAALHRRRLRASLERTVSERTAALSESLSALHAAQRQLVEVEKHAALGRLVYGVAHELNTPLGIALTASSHLADRAGVVQGLIDAQRLRQSDLTEFLSDVRQSVELMAGGLGRTGALVQRFKTMATRDRARVPQVLPLRGMLDEILGFQSERLRLPQGSVQLDCPEALELSTYPEIWREIVEELCDNAVSHGGQVSPENPVQLTVDVDGEHVRVAFRDHGRGFASEAASRAFDPFFTTRRQDGHVGLGLHLVFNLVSHVFGGQLELASSPTAGSTLTWRAPLRHDAQPM